MSSVLIAWQASYAQLSHYSPEADGFLTNRKYTGSTMIKINTPIPTASHHQAKVG